ncbi:MAG: aminoacyl-tRNA hydrolase [Myxococcales bacterium]|nr:aminoacyl-tRNA hydrolase [Myxococcales bacterium]
MAGGKGAKASPRIRAIVGLGNPGPKYAKTRHNIGLMVTDELARRHMLSWQTKFKGRFSKWLSPHGDTIVLQPGTFMNLSGQSVQPMSAFFRIPAGAILVIHDELELPFGELKLKVGGGHGGHNGLRSIGQQLGDRSFVRLRVGIGRPAKGDVANYVLSNFSTDEQGWLDHVVSACADAVERCLSDGVSASAAQITRVC